MSSESLVMHLRGATSSCETELSRSYIFRFCYSASKSSLMCVMSTKVSTLHSYISKTRDSIVTLRMT
jgi:hypothetical protein